MAPRHGRGSAGCRRWAGDIVMAGRFRLLECFIRHRGEAVSRDRLLEEVWDLDAMHPLTRTVDMHVAKLRQKIEDDGSDLRHAPRLLVVGDQRQLPHGRGRPTRPRSGAGASVGTGVARGRSRCRSRWRPRASRRRSRPRAAPRRAAARRRPRRWSRPLRRSRSAPARGGPAGARAGGSGRARSGGWRRLRSLVLLDCGASATCALDGFGRHGRQHQCFDVSPNVLERDVDRLLDDLLQRRLVEVATDPSAGRT